MRPIIMLLSLFAALLFPDPVKASAVSPVWSKGTIDLQQWKFQSSAAIKLNGEWEFYWKKLLQPEDFENRNALLTPQYIKVPSQWGAYEWKGKKLSNQGFATYRLHIILPKGSDKRAMALYVRGVASAYRLWINGVQLAANGQVGSDRGSMSPKFLPRVIYFQPESGRNDLIIQVSNFYQRKGGIWEDIRIGDAERITHQRNVNIITEMFIIGCLVIMGLYHIGLFAFRKKYKVSLYFGGLCLAISLRTLVMGEAIVPYLFPGIPWETAVKIEYISVYICLFMLVQFINLQYPAESRSVIGKLSCIVQGGFTLFVLITPAIVYTRTMLPYQLLVMLPVIFYTIYVYLLATLRKKEGSLINLIGFAVFAATVTNDVLFYNDVIQTGNLVPFGVLFVLFAQSLNLSRTFAKVFLQTESLSEQLKSINESLEMKVQERTSALMDTNDRLEHLNEELSQSEQFRLRLLSNISHELGTPLTSIRGYSEAMLDNVITGNYPKYAKIIYERALLLQQLLDDLVELTKLETRQLRFHYSQQPVVPLLRKLFEKYEEEILERGFHFIWEEVHNSAESGKQAVMSVDPLRLEQVLSNLLSNAQKYTPAGGSISLRVEVRKTSVSDGEVWVEVKDSGAGISKEEQKYIFDRFYRVKNAGQPDPKGSGLGLAICKEIISYHSGEIGVASGIEQGSVFYFKLPVRFDS